MHSIANSPTQSQPSAAQPSRNQRVLEYALAYLERGFSIVPVKPGKKIPAVSWAQYQERQPTISEIEAWFGPGGQFAGGNIALVTGRVSGVFAVDVDGPEGARVVEGLGLPETATNVTKKGRHYLLAYPEDGGGALKNFVRSYPQVDGRADGGIIIVAPSLHPDGDHEYHWDDTLDMTPSEAVASLEVAEAPAWAVGLFTASKRAAAPARAATAAAAGPIREGERNTRVTSLVGGIVANGFNGGLEPLVRLAMSVMRGELAEGVEPLPEDEVRAICQSVLKMEAEKGDKKATIAQLRARDENGDLPASMRAEALKYLTEASKLGVEWVAVVKYAKEKPEYEIRLAGGRRVPVGGIERLSSFKAMTAVLMESLNMKPAWSPGHWEAVLEQLLIAIQTERIDEATNAGLLADWLEGYMSDFQVTHAPYSGDPYAPEWHEAARAKAPFVKDGEYYLNLPEFEGYVSTVAVNARYRPGELATMMAKAGWQRVTMNLPAAGGRPRTTVRVWRVPGAGELVAQRNAEAYTREDGLYVRN